MNFKSAEKQPRKKLRISGYDYTMPGYYFVTLCTYNRECLLGSILNGEMILNCAGKMVERVWYEISQRYIGWSVDTLIVMPNHLHAILEFSNRADEQLMCNSVSFLSLLELMRNVQSYTMTCYRHGVNNQNWLEFHRHLWQRSYYEHIIRDENSLETIRNYILNNPAQWDLDKDNPENMNNIYTGPAR